MRPRQRSACKNQLRTKHNNSHAFRDRNSKQYNFKAKRIKLCIDARVLCFWHLKLWSSNSYFQFISYLKVLAHSSKTVVTYMSNAVLKEQKTFNVQEEFAPSQNSSSDEDIVKSFQSLKLDEAHLAEQKQHLKALLLQLETKVKEEVEKRKRKVERLNSEVSDLKRRCEALAKCVKSESTLECSQAGL